MRRLPSKASIKKEIIAFLNNMSGQVDPHPGPHSCGIRHGNGLVLATSYKDVPRATAVEFFNEGLTIYVFGEPGRKIANIKHNDLVSAFIYEPTDHSKFQQYLQISATAELITVRSNPRLFRAKIRKWQLTTVGHTMARSYIRERHLSAQEGEALIKKGIEALTLIRITPHHIILKEKFPDFSTRRYEWEK